MTHTGSALRAARTAAGMTAVELARVLGISKAMLCYIETGQKKFPIARMRHLPPEMRSRIVMALVADVETQSQAKRDRLLGALGDWIKPILTRTRQ